MATNWIVVPAAGQGRRFGEILPKQYQLLAGRTVIEHTLERLLQIDQSIVVVAIHPADSQWRRLSVFSHPRIRTVHGGKERSDSVRLALDCLQREAHVDDWVLVHDVARPCVRVTDINKLMAALKTHTVGGILAVPVSDTVKQVDQQAGISATVSRADLWLAQTPQMFRYGLLSWSLNSAYRQQWRPTDEASAVEKLGHCPLAVEGSSDNIKITRREDLAIAEAIIKFQNESSKQSGGLELP
ncbi:2-C-methyl-D-erythritol 4-phosphate cytidylyltransferase [uncultured Porticoccus sp.]|uniref:2-C-methyl-D-erythritol 4-phosphate cytidylyltransferase n=1 Tax=uncultured Porticoccus sp. TaxID=1256050 RepID=UPI002620F48C|nr:2-C-methyl-D-erythritol 4-phosphate cytidylyltransferase [uncultured Porticoccus sp.]